MRILQDLRKSKVWQEAVEEGKTLAKKELIQNRVAKGMSAREIPELLGVPAKDVRRLAKKPAK